MIFFNHIPKCAGTTLESILISFFNKNEILLGRDIRRNNISQRSAILYYPEYKIKQAQLIAGHFGELFHQMRIPQSYSIVSLRDPKDRFISLLKHHLRDRSFFNTLSSLIDNKGNINIDNPSFFKIYMKGSIISYLITNHSFLETEDIDWDIELENAKKTLDNYDLVITEKTYTFMLNFFYDIFGIEFSSIPKINTANQYPSQVEPNITDNLLFKAEYILRYDIELYKYAQSLSENLKNDISVNYKDALLYARGGLATKFDYWHLDWSKRQLSSGWDISYQASEQVLRDLYVRDMAHTSAHIYLPLKSNKKYKIRFTFWFKNPERYNDLRIIINNKESIPKYTFPIPKDRHLVIVETEFLTKYRSSFTKIEISVSEKEIDEQICLAEGVAFSI